ncbi:peptidoglycan recognition protein family protein [Anaeromicropila populeti]|uniref:N-acetylmuramoyl-L-alanine amidase n=1 Tax=Anaeromicropila populeti TaxID=37658 RepID=A0A1I6KQF4_9FIRM|nr:peptidoglycan recognition family protein [Anaeromicropila populeti]SFR93446.1 N-acetylmuramoyl-L-alanine amidase [Anaeromicropila populeti]
MARRRLTKKEWKKRRRLKVLLVFSTLVLMTVTIIGVFCSIVAKMQGKTESEIFSSFFPTKKVGKMEVTEMYLTPNEYSRPETPLKKVKGVVVHYTGNPGTDAEANRNYFESLKDTHTTSASSHYVIGLDGTIIQCIPLDEMSYASNKRNVDTISIEVCHMDESGVFTTEAYDSLVGLTAWLCGKFNLKKNDIIRHYDITGKECPKYYVKHEDKWLEFKEDVFQYIANNS